MYISPLFLYIHVAGTGRSGVFITARAEWKPVGVETLSRATPKFHLKREIRKNHSTGMKSIFFSPWGLFPYFIAILGEKRGIRSAGSRTRLISAIRKASLHPAYVNYVNCARRGVLKDWPIAVVRSFGAGPSPIAGPRNSNTCHVRSANITFASTITVDVCIVYLNNARPTYVLLSCDGHVTRPVGFSHLATINTRRNLVSRNCLGNKLALPILRYGRVQYFVTLFM